MTDPKDETTAEAIVSNWEKMNYLSVDITKAIRAYQDCLADLALLVTEQQSRNAEIQNLKNKKRRTFTEMVNLIQADK